ncbi:hypothetical protein ccbrp13_32970 [Ktedonobacteria bacterium brp13]|nr:hypothetical protein ccbrp13_32970 [Ktedonobacteria bacterium brp13]
MRRHPEHLAVLDGREQMTYAQLNARANQLARVLQRAGVGPNVLVGLCLARGVSLLVGLLGILKAGGAYVPLDPEYPTSQLQRQLQVVQVPLLLTQRSLQERLAVWLGPQLYLEDLTERLGQEAAQDLPSHNEGEDIASVIFTSGSTGQPKGVLVRQQSLVNYTQALSRVLGSQPGWQYATVTTLAADLGNTAIFGALTTGGTVHLLDYATVTSTMAYAAWVQQHPIDVLKIVPSHLAALLSGEQARAVLPREALVLGGEALGGELVQQIAALSGRCQVYNHYGPTETTIGVLVKALGVPQTGGGAQEVTLGRPLTNTRVVIRDRRGNVVPIGVTGEVYVGGAGLAQGYVGQAEETAERFEPDGWSGEPGARLYRTGDLGQYTEGGEIRFVGRADRQVKIRGYRVELGEIEEVLRQQVGLKEVRVVWRREEGREGRLIGYVQGRRQGREQREQWSREMRKVVPEYQVPGKWVVVERWPLTENGKIDWRVLREQEEEQEAGGEERKEQEVGRSPMEELVQEIWQEVLGVQEVGLDENFFELGGHSLLATRIIARVRAVVQVEVSIVKLFERPTVAGLAQEIERRLRGGTGEGEEEERALEARARPQQVPLSFAQQRLWFLNQLEPGNTSYNKLINFYLRGSLSTRALEKSLAMIIERHEILRTTFQARAGQPVQVIRPIGTFHIPQIDLQQLATEERDLEARRLVKELAERAYDLALGPLLRVFLLQLQEQEHILLLSMHHIVSDGWSNGIFMRELKALYHAFVREQPSPLQPLSLQYADFALWQRQWLQGELLEMQLDYWKQQLAGVPPLEFPTDHPRPAVQTFRGAYISQALPPALCAQLVELSRREDVTQFMLLLAAFSVLLARYSGQNDISVGTPIANRTHTELENLIGFFVNTLVLRVDLSQDVTFRDVLKRVRKMTIEAYAHQDVPFEYLVERLQPQRDLSRHPFFQVLFGVQQASLETQTLDDLTLQDFVVDHTITKFDITFNIVSTEQGFQCGVEYSTGLFEEETIQRLLEHWQVLLEGIVADPAQPLSRLPLLPPHEQTLLLRQWSGEPHEPVEPRLFCDLFAEQVQRHPDALALVDEQHTLSYAALDRWASALAHLLREQGVGPEVVVGVQVERSVTWLIALLGILKAGGGYLPLDEKLPENRLRHILREAGVHLLVTLSGEQPDWVPADLPVLDVSSCWSILARQTCPLGWRVAVEAENLAYVIYTSGSTGTPKGVQIAHRGLGNLARAQSQLFAVEAHSHVLQYASQSFDASLAEVLVSLLSGASLYLASQPRLLPGASLTEVVERWGITVGTLPPSVLRWQPAGTLSSLQTLVVAGEACPADLGVRWGEGRRFCNAYGPSEVTVCATVGVKAADGAMPPIGKALSGQRVYVLDEQQQVVPVGTAGELYVGGIGEGRGYVGRAAETAERFVPDPFGQQAGGRLYRTGDRVRYRGDGNLEYLGRKDQQVKVRGYRVEPGEIEAVLREREGVWEAVVVVSESELGEVRLVGFVVEEEEGASGTWSEVRGWLQERLPDYMVPTHLVRLKELPLTRSGKIDRQALGRWTPKEEREEGEGVWELGEEYTPLEEVVSGIWQEVLELEGEAIGKDENFFDLGGHSLLATQIIARIQETFQVDILLQSLFEAPTIAGLAQRIEQALRGELRRDLPELKKVSRMEPIPLSFAQQRLWFLDRLEVDNTVYLIPGALHLRGSLNIQALERSIAELILRHESLRTTFSEQAEQAVQIIHPGGTFQLPCIDLRGVPGREREVVAQKLIAQEVQQPFHLSLGPLLRVYLLCISTQEHMLLLTMHHIISDGWSHEILVHELTALYRACISGQPSPLPPLAIQYADFTLWQRQWLQGELLEYQLRYWLEQLTDAPLLDLPLDHPRSPVQTYRGATQKLVLPSSLREQLVALSKEQHVTLFMLLLAAFNSMLVRYTGQSDLSVGTPIANRIHSELEGIVGFFVNTLVMRTNLAGNPSFVEVIRRVREVALGAYAHQDVPFEYVVERLQPERDLSRSPLFQVAFSVQQMAHTVENVEGLILSKVNIERSVARFDLNFTLVSTEEGLHCFLEYNTDLFEAATIQRLLEHWQVFLQGIVADPTQRLADLPLLTSEEWDRLLVTLNTTMQTPSNEAVYLHQLFEQQARQFPDCVAVVYEEEHLTYAQLDRRANQVAHALRARGVGADSIVGVSLPRSPELAIALLAILKAGGAYLPLDVTLPRERLHFLLIDAQPALVIATRKQVQTLIGEVVDQSQLLCLDQAWLELSAEATHAPTSVLQKDNLAYVIYTSGSTGQPKGTMITHRGLSNYVSWGSAYYEVERGSGSIVHSSIGFDLTVTSLFMPLLVGRSVCLVPEEENIEGLLHLLRQRKHTGLLKITPAHLEALNQYLAPEELSEIAHTLVIGGEALGCEGLRTWRRSAPQTRLINEYGPTETVVGCCIYEVVPEDPETGMVPIGFPIANTQLYILDQYLQPVPTGVVGELYIGGEGLTRGYLNRAELTAERFLPDPFSKSPGVRLYKSGDLARYRPDGCIEYLGRNDEQVKVRGYRIELGEIDAVLRQHPDVQDAVVLLRTEPSGDPRLIGYIVAQAEETPASESLRAFLGSHLPAYMIPSAFLFLNALPLTANGKVDRRQLLKMPVEHHFENHIDSAPRTPIEEILWQIWRDLLGAEAIGIYDNFFALGGHSLLAMRLVSQMRSTLHVELPLRSVFEVSTIAGQAKLIEQALGGEVKDHEPPLVPVSRTDRLPLSFAQQRLWLLCLLEPENRAYIIPAAQRLRGVLDRVALEQSIAMLVQRHETLRTTFSTRSGEPVQIIHPAGEVSLPLLDLSGLAQDRREAEARRLATQEAQRAFHLEQGPLLRCSLLCLDDREHILLLVMHHIVLDGWSSNIFQHELAILYRALSAGRSSSLAPLPIQYADFAVWQRQWLQGAVLDRQMDYWQQQLAGVPPLELPTDHPRPAVQTFRGASASFTLPLALQEKLIALSESTHVTLFILLLAAFQALLACYTEQTDICVGTAVANRTRSETELLIGFFVNILALRTNLSGDPTFLELLNRVREVTLDAYAHQDIPFELLVEKLQVERARSRAPLAQVLFGLVQPPFEVEDLAEAGGLIQSDFKIEHDISKYEMTFSVVSDAHGLRCNVEYNIDLFESHTIQRFLEHWQMLLEGIVAEPRTRLSDLPLLTERERQMLLLEWNMTQTALPGTSDFPRSFEKQAVATPDAIALVSGNGPGEPDTHLSYGELNRRANQLAHVLREQGVGPEVLVGVLLDRSVNLVICLLAVLKAGGGYVPLDLSYPDARLTYMLNDANVSLLLTDQQYPQISIPAHARIIQLDRLQELLAQQSTKNLVDRTGAGNIAYVIYTSGSTGAPKGVVVTHAGLVNLAQVQARAFEVDSESHVLQFASPSFDASISEIVVTLLAGGSLYLIAREETLPGPGLVKVLAERAISVLTLPPSALAGLPVELFPDMHTLVVAGEACPADLVERWAGTRRFCNAYGPTEATVCASIATEIAFNGRKPSIGWPIANIRLYVLDAYLQPVPIGVPGELHIGGIGLARGYLNQPELTAERFIPDPFSEYGGERLYKTGDRVRYRSDGSLEYLGRLDQQVKVRGYRIELEEIEAVLLQHPAVHECIVLMREDVPGDQRLVAYLVPGERERLFSWSEMHTWLEERLPEYMLPSHIVTLKELPLSPAGKIDRRNLPPPSQIAEDENDDLVLPRTPLEEQLAEIWCDVLGDEEIGVYDNFFALGGHSLLAMRLITQVQKKCQVDLPLNILFDAPTIAELAEVIKLKQNAQIEQNENEELLRMLNALEELSEDEIRLMLNSEM